MKNYVLIILLVLFANSIFAQIQVSQFNAAWNKANEVSWVGELSDCETISYIDIGTQANMAKAHKIAVVPTVIIFKDGDEVARFQADLSFKMVATREEVQEKIDEIIMSDF
jgi:thiol-disulfide isomerase/thioredoxin